MDSSPIGSGPGTGPEPPLFDYAAIRRWLRFAIRGARRHPFVAAAAFLLTLGGTVAALAVLPRNHRAEARLVVAPGGPMPFLVNPRRPFQDEVKPSGPPPSQLVLRRDDLVALVREHDLVRRWEEERAPLQRFLEWLRAGGRPAPTEEERVDALVARLEDRITITAKDGQVTFGVVWPSPQVAAALANAALRRFVEARRAEEVTAVGATVAILQGQVDEVHQRMQATLAQIKALRDAKRKGARPSTLRSLQAEGRWRNLPDRRLEELRQQVLARRKTISEMEDTRRKRLAELQAQLAEQRTTYAATHPLVRSTEERIAALAVAPEVDRLRAEERALVRDFVGLGGKDVDLSPEPTSAWPTELDSGDPELEYARAQLHLLEGHHAELRQRADTARSEFIVAEAAFRNRYSVAWPAQARGGAGSRFPAPILASAVLASALVSLLAVVMVDLSRGRLLEPWQVEAGLGLPLLGRVGASS